MSQVIIKPTVDADTLEELEYGVQRVQSFQVIGKPVPGETIKFEIKNDDDTWRVLTVNEVDAVIDEYNDVITFYAPVEGRFNKSTSAGNPLGLKSIS